MTSVLSDCCASDEATHFTCASKLGEDGQRIVALHISKRDNNGDFSTDLICFSMQPVPDGAPIPGSAIEANNQIVPAAIFLQTVLDHAWALGFRPSPEHAAATREESLARTAAVDVEEAAMTRAIANAPWNRAETKPADGVEPRLMRF